MTTIAFSRRHGQIAADSCNTDASGARFQVDKIERLQSGCYFLGCGHLLTINQCKEWAETGFDPECIPDFELFLEDPEEYGFGCLVISEDGSEAILLDGEMTPAKVLDDLLAIGSGAAYALGAMEAGASPIEAVEIAIARDGNSAGPVRMAEIERKPGLHSVS